MYYIYHIPGIKIGCTKYYPKRPASQSDNYELLEVHEDIETASKREIELQKQYGFKCPSGCTYMESTKRVLKAQKLSPGSKGKKLGSEHKKAIEIGRKKYNLKKTECPHCKKNGQHRAMLRWHFENCKNKNNNALS